MTLAFGSRCLFLMGFLEPLSCQWSCMQNCHKFPSVQRAQVLRKNQENRMYGPCLQKQQVQFDFMVISSMLDHKCVRVRIEACKPILDRCRADCALELPPRGVFHPVCTCASNADQHKLLSKLLHKAPDQ